MVTREIRGISVTDRYRSGYPGKDYDWSDYKANDMSIKEGDMVVIIAKDTPYEVIAEVYSLAVGPATGTLSVIGSDNHIYTLSPKAYYDARNLYLELYNDKDVVIGLNTPTDDSGCHHISTERMVGQVFLEEYIWRKCRDCGSEV